jgi:hypothetical protein
MKLSDKIWVTRKTRIITEKRLQTCAIISEVFMIFFSLIMVFFSIWNFIHQNGNINFLLICGSIGVLTVSIFLTSQRFNERALAMRNCYIRLDELYFKTINIEETQNPNSLQDLVTIYNDILLNIENHSDYDYLCLRYSLRKQLDTTLPEFTKFDYCRYVFEKITRLVFIIFIFSLPFILLIFHNFFK